MILMLIMRKMLGGTGYPLLFLALWDVAGACHRVVVERELVEGSQCGFVKIPGDVNRPNRQAIDTLLKTRAHLT